MRRPFLATLVAILVLPTAVLAQSVPQPSGPAAAIGAAGATKGGFADTPEAKARYEKFRAACGADLTTHCATVQRGSEQGRGEMRQCIDLHKAKFSATCQAALVERDAAREARRQGQAQGQVQGQAPGQAPVMPAAADKPKT